MGIRNFIALRIFREGYGWGAAEGGVGVGGAISYKQTTRLLDRSLEAKLVKVVTISRCRARRSTEEMVRLRSLLMKKFVPVNVQYSANYYFVGDGLCLQY